MEKHHSLKTIFLSGIWKENPVLRLVLGCCATLALTTQAVNAIGMGLATTFVLVCSNLVISLIRDLIPDRVRIPAYIAVIAGFVTIVQQLVQAFSPGLYDALGIFLPLIVVNCIILARAEVFANKNPLLPSIVDGFGMGMGFTLTLLAMGTIREILGNGTWFGMTLTAGFIDPMLIFALPAGGFFVFGCLMALMNVFNDRLGHKRAELGCANCPAACAACRGDAPEPAKADPPPDGGTPAQEDATGEAPHDPPAEPPEEPPSGGEPGDPPAGPSDPLPRKEDDAQ